MAYHCAGLAGSLDSGTVETLRAHFGRATRDVGALPAPIDPSSAASVSSERMPTSSYPEQRARAVLEELGIRQLPVPAAAIAERLGAEVSYGSMASEVSGVLTRKSGKSSIEINADHSAARQRFTLAHECGHLLLHQGTYVDRLGRVNWRNGKSDWQEVEANAFAAELLMPRAAIIKETGKLTSSAKELRPELLVSKLAEIFAVSKQAMQYRLAKLGVLEP